MRNLYFIKIIVWFSAFMVFMNSENTIKAQNAVYELSGSFGSTNADEPRCAVTDGNGNYYVAGFGAGDLNLPSGTLTGRGGNDAVVIKFDSCQNMLWARYVGGSGNDVFEGLAVNSLGDVYLVGKVGGAVTIDGTEQTLTPVNSAEGCIVIYDKDGNYKDARLITGTGGNSLCYAVVVDEKDSVYFTGYTIGSTDLGNGVSITPDNGTNVGLFVAKYNASLVCQWALTGDCSGNATAEGWRITLDKDDHIVLTGRFGTILNIKGTDNKTVSNSAETTATQQGFVSRITNGGSCQWIKRITTTSRIDMNGVASDSNGNIIIMGTANGTVNVEGNTQPLANAGNFDHYVVKFSSDGGYLNALSLGGPNRDEGKSVAVDKANNIYISGNMNGTATTGTTINFNPKGTSVERTCYGHDAFYAKYNGETFELIQVEKTTTPSKLAQHEVAFHVTLSKDNSRIYTLGYFNNAATIFDGESGTVTLPNAGSYDIYWMTYSTRFIVKTQTLPDGLTGDPYYALIETVNTQGTVNYTLTEGALPEGLSLSAAGVISGTPTSDGVFTFTVTISDEVNTMSRVYTVAVTSNECNVRIIQDHCPDIHINEPYSFQFTSAVGEGLQWSVTGGNLPAGMELSSAGILAGTSADNDGIYSFKVRAEENASCYDELQINVIVTSALGVGSLENLKEYAVFPVPADDELNVKLMFDLPGDVSIKLISLLQVTVWEGIYSSQTVINETIQTGNLAPGIYYLIVATKEGKEVQQIVIGK